MMMVLVVITTMHAGNFHNKFTEMHTFGTENACADAGELITGHINTPGSDSHAEYYCMPFVSDPRER